MYICRETNFKTQHTMGIIDLFIQRDEAQAQSVNTAQPTVTSAPIVQSQGTALATATPSVTSDAEIVNKLWDVIISKNLPGPDYLELKNNVSALEDLPIPDEQKLVTAFKILKKSYPSFSKEDILKSIDTYTGIVNEEKTSGLAEVEKLRDSKVRSKEELISKMKKTADDLKRQYDDTIKQINELVADVTISKADIDTKQNAFISSIDTVLGVLSADKTKVSSLNI